MAFVALVLVGCAQLPKLEARLEKDAAIATTICQRAAPVLKLAAYFPSPELHLITVPVGALCALLLAGVVPETFDVNTVSWLEQNLIGVLARFPR